MKIKNFQSKIFGFKRGASRNEASLLRGMKGLSKIVQGFRLLFSRNPKKSSQKSYFKVGFRHKQLPNYLDFKEIERVPKFKRQRAARTLYYTLIRA